MKNARKSVDILSRRNFLAKAGALAAGGVVATGAMTNFAQAKPTEPGPLPWPWTKLDPQEAGERAFRTYHEKGG
ncbi:MAG: twin-arginine translocation signal domain-containing protein [Deferrisomatales bacterium]